MPETLEGAAGGADAPSPDPKKPEPCKHIYLHGFLGDRTPAFLAAWKKKLADAEAGTGPNPTLHEALIFAGHVGVSFEAQKPIIGFLPKAPPGEEMWQTLKNLVGKQDYPGRCGDDTSIFDAARTHGLKIVTADLVYPESEYNRIKAWYDAQRSSTNLRYGFPGAGDCNCALFPARAEPPIQIPEATGNMKHYMPALEKLAAQSPVKHGECEG